MSCPVCGFRCCEFGADADPPERFAGAVFAFVEQDEDAAVKATAKALAEYLDDADQRRN